MNVEIRNKFIEIKYCVSNGLVILVVQKLLVVQNFGNKQLSMK